MPACADLVVSILMRPNHHGDVNPKTDTNPTPYIPY